MGLVVASLGANDLIEGKPHMILGILWQVIKKGLLSKLDINVHPEMAMMLNENESIYNFMAQTPEHNLIRWVNFHLGRTDYPNRIGNFRNDISDAKAYLALLESVAPQFVPPGVFSEPDLNTRAIYVCEYAKQMGCGGLIAPEDIMSGNEKLNMAFTAYLFNKYPGLDPPDQQTQIRGQSELDMRRQQLAYEEAMLKEKIKKKKRRK